MKTQSADAPHTLPVAQLSTLPPSRAIPEIITRLERFSGGAQVELASAGSISSTTYQVLMKLTEALLQTKMREAGGEIKDPYWQIRKLAPLMMKERVEGYLKGKRILVTGGAGAIGGVLCQRILNYKPSEVSVLDKDETRLAVAVADLQRSKESALIRRLDVDVTSESSVRQAYEAARPEVVFHLAAERDPGLAEANVRDAIRTNVLGSRYLAQLASEFSVERFIYASTGQCRFVYDERVYPATERFAEAAIKTVANESSTRFSLVRIHHVVDNSIVERTFRSQATSGQPLTVHLPEARDQFDREKYGQSLQEAVAMLLHSGLYGYDAEVFSSGQPMASFSVVDLALYVLGDTKCHVPILFKRAEPKQGYEAGEFGGTRFLGDDGKVLGFTDALNIIETVGYRILQEPKLIMTPFPSVDVDVACRLIGELGACVKRASASTEEIKAMLKTSLRELALDMYGRAPLNLAIEALASGAHPDCLSKGHVEDHLPIITILVAAINRRLDVRLSYKQRIDLQACWNYLSEGFRGTKVGKELVAQLDLLKPKLSV